MQNKCDREMHCPKCGKRAELVGTSQQADGRVFCIYYCEGCEDNFEIEKRGRGWPRLRNGQREEKRS